MTTRAANDLLFGDTLACEERRPAVFLPGALDAGALAAANARGEALLLSLAVVEDGVRSEEPEQPHEHALHRLEAKLDLLTALVASLVSDQYGDAVQSLQWSARGARLLVDAHLVDGTEGWFRIRPADALPTPLVLPATVLACDQATDGSHQAWLRFGPLSHGLEGALERHLFRVHRRAVAESRRPR